MRAARLFVQRLAHDGLADRVARLRIGLYGSLGATGKGHGSDKAVLLGLLGEAPDTVDVDAVPGSCCAQVRWTGHHPAWPCLRTAIVAFDEKTDLKFFRRETLPFHANGMRCEAFGMRWRAAGRALLLLGGRRLRGQRRGGRRRRAGRR